MAQLTANGVTFHLDDDFHDARLAPTRNDGHRRLDYALGTSVLVNVASVTAHATTTWYGTPLTLRRRRASSDRRLGPSTTALTNSTTTAFGAIGDVMRTTTTQPNARPRCDVGGRELMCRGHARLPAGTSPVGGLAAGAAPGATSPAKGCEPHVVRRVANLARRLRRLAAHGDDQHLRGQCAAALHALSSRVLGVPTMPKWCVELVADDVARAPSARSYSRRRTTSGRRTCRSPLPTSAVGSAGRSSRT